MTALVLAGGSASVNNLFVALSLRQPKTIDAVTPKAPPNKAWVAIKILNVGENDKILVVDAANGEGASASTEHIVGVIPAAGLRERLAKYFVRDRNRLPMSNGFVVDPETEYAFVIRRTRPQGTTFVTENFDLTGRALIYISPIDPTTKQPVDPNDPKKADGGLVSVSELTPPPRRYSFAKGAVIDFRVTLPG